MSDDAPQPPSDKSPSGRLRIHRDDLDDVLGVAAELQMAARAEGVEVFEGDDFEAIEQTTGVDAEMLARAAAVFEQRKRRRRMTLFGTGAALLIAGAIAGVLLWPTLFPPDPEQVRLQAVGLTKQAVTARKDKRHREAIRLAEEAVRVRPEHYAAWNILGLAHVERDDFVAAAEAYRKGIAVAPQERDASDLFYNYATLLNKAPETREEAVAMFKRALACRPDASATHNNLGFTYEKMGRYEEARASYRAAVRYDPKNAIAEKNLTALEALMGLPASGNQKLEAKLQAESLRKQGDALYYKRSYDAALKLYLQALRIDPSSYKIWNDVGLTYEKKNDLVQAQRAFREGVRGGGHAPDNAYAHFNLARMISDAGQQEEAIKMYGEALKCRPGYAAALNNMGWCYDQLGRYREAAAAYERAIAADPSYERARSNLQKVKRKLRPT